MWRPSRWPNGYRDAATFIACCVLVGAVGSLVVDRLRGRHGES